MCSILVHLSSQTHYCGNGRLRGETMMPGQRTRPEVRRWLSDERRQYDSERRRLVPQQQSNSLRSLTAHERDRQSTARHCQDHALTLFLSRRPPPTSHVCSARHEMHIPSWRSATFRWCNTLELGMLVSCPDPALSRGKKGLVTFGQFLRLHLVDCFSRRNSTTANHVAESTICGCSTGNSWLLQRDDTALF